MIIGRGAESTIERHDDYVVKKRISKGYRISQIDLPLRRFRTRREAKVLEKLSKVILVPKLIDVNDNDMAIKMEFIDGEKLVDIFDDSYKTLCPMIGKIVAKIHSIDVIHGDLTTSNMILKKDYTDKDKKTKEDIYFIDFGLSYFSIKPEDKAVDLHLLFQALESKHYRVYDDARKLILFAYEKEYPLGKDVVKRLADVEKRGRNKH
jgi:TP53 regulating kinase-like protein